MLSCNEQHIIVLRNYYKALFRTLSINCTTFKIIISHLNNLSEIPNVTQQMQLLAFVITPNKQPLEKYMVIWLTHTVFTAHPIVSYIAM